MIALTHRQSELQGILLGRYSILFVFAFFEVQTQVVIQPNRMHQSLVRELYCLLRSYIRGSYLWHYLVISS